MIKRQLFALSAPVVASLLFVTLLLAQSSANFDLQWQALTSGGGQRASANFVLQDALGEMTSGASTSANVGVQAGFVVGFGVAPVANGQTVTTTINTAKAITLTGSDADNDALTYTITISPTNGTLSGTAPNLTYTPNAGFSGNDSFTFRAHDGTVDSDAAVVTILIEKQGNTNQPPIAVADAVTITASVAVTISVLTNDSDPDGDALTVTINQQPQHGSAVVKDGAIVYTPSANFSGVDSFTYTITDGKGATASATITITVKAQDSGSTIYLPIVSK